jgi:hypothetical protein
MFRRKVLRRRWALAVAGVWILSAAACGGVKATPGGDSTPAKEAAFVPGQIIVLFDEGVSAARQEELVAATGGDVAERSAVNPARLVVTVPVGREDDFVAKYRKLHDVQAADKNYISKAAGGTN